MHLQTNNLINNRPRPWPMRPLPCPPHRDGCCPRLYRDAQYRRRDGAFQSSGQLGWLKRYREALEELPHGWLQLYLSSSNYGHAVSVSPNLLQLRGSYQTTAILYSRAGIEAARQCLRHSGYAIEPRIAYQNGGFSDIMGFDRGDYLIIAL